MTTRVETCACGGVIVADPDDPVAVAEAVREHQATAQHRAWTARIPEEPRLRRWTDVADGYERKLVSV